MENPTLNIKSDELVEILQRVSDYEALSPAKQKDYYDDKNTQQNGEFLIGTFVLDLLRCGYRSGAALDLSYDTVKSLPLALGRSLREDITAGKDLKSAAEGVAKAFAAYLFALGMNEEGTSLKVSQKGTAFIRPAPEEGSGVYRDGRRLMLLSVGPGIRAYRAAFGVDLSEYGLCDMMLEADANE